MFSCRHGVGQSPDRSEIGSPEPREATQADEAFPWSSFKVNKEQGNVVPNVTPEQLQTRATDLSPDIQALEEQLQTMRKSESRKGVREGENLGDRGAAGPMGETKVGGGGPVGPPVSNK